MLLSLSEGDNTCMGRSEPIFNADIEETIKWLQSRPGTNICCTRWLCHLLSSRNIGLCGFHGHVQKFHVWGDCAIFEILEILAYLKYSIWF